MRGTLNFPQNGWANQVFTSLLSELAALRLRWQARAAVCGLASPRLALSTAQATRTLASAQVASLLHTLRSHLKEKRLLFFTIASFLSLYAIAAYVLMARGLAFIHAILLLGPRLTKRLIYVPFSFSF